MTDDEEKTLKQELLMADLDLRRKQATWETPRNIALLAGAIAAVTAAVFGVLGYKIGSIPPAPLHVVIDPAPPK